jgi:outer membrane biosynthesis protein TonB
MNRLSLSSWIASGVLHGLAVVPFALAIGVTAPEIYNDGTGQDAFKLEQGIAIDMVSLGDAADKVDIAEVTPMLANPTPPPVVETKPIEPELKAVITATQSPTEVAAVTEEQPMPVVTPPEVVAMRDQVAQVEQFSEKSAGSARDGGKATALNAYRGQINGALSRVQPNKWSKRAGLVVVRFTVDAAGRVKSNTVLKSSGSAALDGGEGDVSTAPR